MTPSYGANALVRMAYQPDRCASAGERREAATCPERRLGERSPRPRASLSVTLKIEVARVHLQTGSSATGLPEATLGHSGMSCPVRRSAMDGYGALDLARCMRQMSTSWSGWRVP
jgi:hypothetical protein